MFLCYNVRVRVSFDRVFHMKNKLLRTEEELSTHYREINRNTLIGWAVIVTVLIITYSIEVAKGARSPAYIAVFTPVLVLPLLAALIVFIKKPGWRGLCYVIVPGYFVMYLFVMVTGNTDMVFSYMLPLLSLLILYHHPQLILCTGAASVFIALLAIILHYCGIDFFVSQSTVTTRDAEIQIALLTLCFGGCYFACRLYNKITKQNHTYIQALNEKTAQIQRMSLQTIITITNILDAKDPYTVGHSQRVSAYSSQLARGLGLNEDEVENIRKIALMHDIGKIGVPDNLLNKPGRLDKDEYERMKHHAEVGGEIIKQVTTIPGIYGGVRYHHERYDGTGYPDGLKGEDIPYIARIIAVADSYDAMTSNRVYRKHLSDEQVLKELVDGAGTQFDPEIARKMIELIHSGEIKNLSAEAETDINAETAANAE